MIELTCVSIRVINKILNKIFVNIFSLKWFFRNLKPLSFVEQINYEFLIVNNLQFTAAFSFNLIFFNYNRSHQRLSGIKVVYFKYKNKIFIFKLITINNKKFIVTNNLNKRVIHRKK